MTTPVKKTKNRGEREKEGIKKEGTSECRLRRCTDSMLLGCLPSLRSTAPSSCRRLRFVLDQASTSAAPRLLLRLLTLLAGPIKCVSAAST